MSNYIAEPLITIVGSGNVAEIFYRGLFEAGFNLEGVLSRNKKTAEQIINKYKVGRIIEQGNNPINSNLFLIAIDDSEILNAALTLSSLNINFNNSLFFHTSGALDSSQLNILAEKGAHTASLHIISSFIKDVPFIFSDKTASIESDFTEAYNYLQNNFCVKLKMKSFKIKKEDKPLYHTAAAVITNFIYSNISFSEKILTEFIEDQNIIHKLISEGLKTSLNNYITSGTDLITGPAARGDFNLIKAHINELSNSEGISEYHILNYITQTILIIDALPEHQKTKSHEEIKNYLMSILFPVF